MVNVGIPYMDPMGFGRSSRRNSGSLLDRLDGIGICCWKKTSLLGRILKRLGLEFWETFQEPLKWRTHWWNVMILELNLNDTLGGAFKYVFFHPYFWKISNLTNIFQMGWNHQPVQHLLDISNSLLTLIHYHLLQVWLDNMFLQHLLIFFRPKSLVMFLTPKRTTKKRNTPVTNVFYILPPQISLV